MYCWFRRVMIVTFAAALFGATAVSLFVCRFYTDPETVRRLLIQRVHEEAPSLKAEIQSARVRPLGGVTLRGMSLKQRDLDGVEREIIRHEEMSIAVDPDQLVEGKLRLKRAMIVKPFLHLHRGSDGKWNVARLMTGKPLTFREPAVIEFVQGTILTTFADPTRPAIEFTDLSGNVRMDPPSVLTLQVTGKNAALREMSVRARIDLSAASLQIDEAKIDALDLARLLTLAPTGWKARIPQAEEIAGQVNVSASGRLAWANGAVLWDGRAAGALTNGAAAPPDAPYPVKDATAKFVLDRDGLAITEGSLTSGPCRGRFSAKVPHWNFAEAQLDFTLDDVPFSKEVFACAKPSVQTVWEKFSPEGVARYSGVLRIVEGRPRFIGKVLFKDDALTFDGFRYRVTNVDGSVEIFPDGSIEVDGVGRAGPAPLTVQGRIAGSEPTSAVEFTLRGKGVPIDDALRRALPAGASQAVDKIHGGGAGDAKVLIRREAGATAFHTEIFADLSIVDLSCDWFPYQVKKVRGLLHMTPDRLEFSDVRGGNGDGAAIRMKGWLQRDPPSGADDPKHAGLFLHLDFSAADVPMDGRLRSALRSASPKDDLQNIWDGLRPEGRLALTCRLEKAGDAPLALSFRFDGSQAAITPVVFPYRLDRFDGPIQLRNGVVSWENVTAHHGDVRLQSNSGRLDPTPGGGQLTFDDLHCPALPFDPALRAAVPASLREVFDFLSPSKPANLLLSAFQISWKREGRAPKIDIGQAEVAFAQSDLLPAVGAKDVTCKLMLSGEVREKANLQGNLAVDSITLAGMTATDLTARMNVLGPTFELANMHGDLYGGRLDVPILRATVAPVPEYECKVQVMKASLSNYVRAVFHTTVAVDGYLDVLLYLTGSGADIGRIHGTGNLDLRRLDIRRLPIVIDQLDYFFKKVPEGRTFDQAHAEFRLDGLRAEIDKLKLSNAALSFVLREKPGVVELSTGQVDLHMTPELRGGVRIPFFSDTSAFRVHGPMGEPSVTLEPISGAVSGLKRVLTPRRTNTSSN